MPRTTRRAAACWAPALLVALALLVSGCASFPDAGSRAWQDKVQGAGELGSPPQVPGQQPPGGESGQGQPPPPSSGQSAPPAGCVDPDPQVVATCLEPVSAVAVLPDGQSALVAERATGRVLRVQKDTAPALVATIPVDATGGGGLTGLVLSPSYAEDQLVYGYVSTATDNRVVRIATGEAAKPILAAIPRGASENGGALGVDASGALLVATGSAGSPAPAPGSLAGKLLRITTLGKPAPDNPDPASPIYATGLRAPGGVCTDKTSGTSWVTDRLADRDALYQLRAGPVGAPAWTWPTPPGVAGCVAAAGVIVVAQTGASSLFVLQQGPGGSFTGDPQTLLAGTYGRLTAATSGPDSLIWLGTANKGGGGPVVPSDDRVIRIQPPAGGGASRA